MTEEEKMRRNKLQRFFEYRYQDANDFREDFKNRAMEKKEELFRVEDDEEEAGSNGDGPEAEIERAWERIRRSLNGGKRFSSRSAWVLEQVFSMREGAMRQEFRLRHAYVMIECEGKDKKPLVEKLKGCSLVQEISVVAGSTDIIARLSGSRDDIDAYMLSGIHVSNPKPLRTATCYAMYDNTSTDDWCNWSRLDPIRHPDYDTGFEFFTEPIDAPSTDESHGIQNEIDEPTGQ